MASVTIRGLDDALTSRLRERAARHARPMEEEAREILMVALAHESSGDRNLPEAIRERIEPLGGVDLDIPPREPVRRPPKLTR